MWILFTGLQKNETQNQYLQDIYRTTKPKTYIEGSIHYHFHWKESISLKTVIVEWTICKLSDSRFTVKIFGSHSWKCLVLSRKYLDVDKFLGHVSRISIEILYSCKQWLSKDNLRSGAKYFCAPFNKIAGLRNGKSMQKRDRNKNSIFW